jgi:predicted O-linked N-acetylglucosamine transferase (SPINDLY family)
MTADVRYGPVGAPGAPAAARPGRNEPCTCGSGRKFKHCCLNVPGQQPLQEQAKASYELGNRLFAQGRFAEAERCFRSAIATRPNFVQAHVNLGNSLLDQGQSEAALASFRRALALEPAAKSLNMNIGLALHALRRFDEAIESYRRGLTGHLMDAQIYCNLGAAHQSAERNDDALASFRAAIAMYPDMSPAYHHIGNILVEKGDVEGALDAYRRTMAIDARAHATLSSMMFAMLYSDRHGSAERAQMRRVYAQSYETPLMHMALPHANSPEPDRRLKVGYVSGDFRDHSVAFFVEPVLEHHDRTQVEVFAYYTNVRKDEVTARLRAAVDHWRDCIEMSDEALCERVRADGIDVLVDLAGHTYGNRLLAFARKPAPVQLSWVGCPMASGLRAIDYFLTDERASPSGAPHLARDVAALDGDGLVRLPEVFSVYRPPEAPPVQATPALAAGRVTLGSFNKFAKMSDRTVALWSRLLQQEPGFSLLLKDVSYTDAGVREATLARFAAHGVDPARLRLVGRTAEKSAHLAMYAEVDVALDTYPYCGVTTSCEALWMGVPVVSLVGEDFVSRMGATLLHAVGHPQWAVADEDAYIACVRDLAADVARLNAVRLALRSQMQSSALCQEAAFTRNLENAYRQMWRTWCTGKRPA